MRFTHVFSGDDGRSHFADRRLRGTESELGATTVAVPAESLWFRDTEGGPTEVPHRTAPRRQFVVLLRGRVEYECGGERRSFGPGDVVLFDDLTGEGHAARVLESPRVQLFFRVPDDLDLDALA